MTETNEPAIASVFPCDADGESRHVGGYGEHVREYLLNHERQRQLRSARPVACAVGPGESEACQ